MGIPPMADDFRTAMKISSPIWVDGKRETYRYFEFTHGLDKVLGVKSMFNAVRALSKGHIQHKTQGNPAQNGGVGVVNRKGECVYAYASAVAGDKPPLADVLKAARAAG